MLSFNIIYMKAKVKWTHHQLCLAAPSWCALAFLSHIPSLWLLHRSEEWSYWRKYIYVLIYKRRVRRSMRELIKCNHQVKRVRRKRRVILETVVFSSRLHRKGALHICTQHEFINTYQLFVMWISCTTFAAGGHYWGNRGMRRSEYLLLAFE